MISRLFLLVKIKSVLWQWTPHVLGSVLDSKLSDKLLYGNGNPKAISLIRKVLFTRLKLSTSINTNFWPQEQTMVKLGFGIRSVGFVLQLLNNISQRLLMLNFQTKIHYFQVVWTEVSTHMTFWNIRNLENSNQIHNVKSHVLK